MKHGIHTTEFYLTLLKGLVGPVLAILVAVGYLTPGSEGEVTGHVEQIGAALVALVGLFMSGRVIQTYTDARTTTKIGEMQLEAAITEAMNKNLTEGEAQAIGFAQLDEEEEDDDNEE